MFTIIYTYCRADKLFEFKLTTESEYFIENCQSISYLTSHVTNLALSSSAGSSARSWCGTRSGCIGCCTALPGSTRVTCGTTRFVVLASCCSSTSTAACWGFVNARKLDELTVFTSIKNRLSTDHMFIDLGLLL